MLYVVSTPIGSLKDVTLRAIEILKAVDVIYCEDTRVSGKLLKQYNITTPLRSYHDHSSDKEREKIKSLLKEGKSLALISDAGSPLIADPGFKLIRLLQKENIPYTVVPGSCSVIAALQLSGLPTNKFSFHGFLPTKKKAREEELKARLCSDETIVCFETASRIIETIQMIVSLSPFCEVAIVREITKIYEEVITGTATEVLAQIEKKAMKGEIVLCFKSADGHELDALKQEKIKAKLKELLPYMGVKKASAFLSKDTDLSKHQLYQWGLEIEKKNS